MRKAVLFTSSILFLSACEQIGEIETFASCTDRIEAVFPEAKGLSNQDVDGEIEGFGELKRDGSFSYQVRNEDGSQHFACSGNPTVRQINEVWFKGTRKAPAASEIWSY